MIDNITSHACIDNHAVMLLKHEMKAHVNMQLHASMISTQIEEEIDLLLKKKFMVAYELKCVAIPTNNCEGNMHAYIYSIDRERQKYISIMSWPYTNLLWCGQ